MMMFPLTMLEALSHLTELIEILTSDINFVLYATPGQPKTNSYINIPFCTNIH